MVAHSDLVSVSNAFYVPVEAIEPNPFQPRQHFSEAQLTELSESIREHGVLQPVLLRPHPTKPGFYQLVSGERRWRACQKIGRSEISALIRNFSDLETRQLALQENIQRQSLTDFEEARGLEGLWSALEQAGEKVNKKVLARRLSMSLSYISNRLDALGYHENVQELLARHQGILTSARAINAIADFKRRQTYIALVDKGASYAEVSRAIETDEAQLKAKRQTRRAPEAQTQQRLTLHEKGEGGGGMVSRGEVVTGGAENEANREVLRAIGNLEAWVGECDEETFGKVQELARRVLRGDLSR